MKAAAFWFVLMLLAMATAAFGCVVMVIVAVRGELSGAAVALGCSVVSAWLAHLFAGFYLDDRRSW